MATATKSKPKVKVEEIIQGKVLEALDAGIIPWHIGFSSAGLHRSIKGHVYRNSNQFLTQVTALIRGFTSPYWLTWNNVTKDFGGTVKDGEEKNYTIVTYYKRIKVTDKNTGDEKSIPLLRYFRVYNLDQCDIPTENLPKRVLAEMVEKDDFDPVAEAESIVDNWLAKPAIRNAPVDTGSYYPNLDEVVMPNRSQAESGQRYYKTLFHELTHSTGHVARLNREGVAKCDRTDSDKYGKEELIAEMGAAFLSGHAGISDDTLIENTVAYIQHWRDVIAGDKNIVIAAGKEAQKAVDMILGTTFEKEADTE